MIQDIQNIGQYRALYDPTTPKIYDLFKFQTRCREHSLYVRQNLLPDQQERYRNLISVMRLEGHIVF